MPVLLQINATANWGSTGRIAEQLGNKVMENGWHSYIAYGRYSNSSNSNLIRVGSKINPYIHYLQHYIFDKEGRASRKATLDLIKKIDRIKPDIIHLHNIHDHWLNYELLFSYISQTNIKTIWTFHDFWAITGHCAHFIHYNCHKWKDVCCNCPATPLIDNSKNNYLLKKGIFSSYDNLNIVAVSDWVKSHLDFSFLKQKNIHTIPNGIDLSIFKPSAKRFINERIKDKFVILSVASQWKFGKGFNDFIKMSKLLKDDEIIVLVGVNGKLKKMLPSNILGVDRTDCNEDLVSLYSTADVVTSFSSAETFGMTVIEGFACGTPAVVYNNTALPYLITEDTGIVVPNKDYIAAYNAIQTIKNKGRSYYKDKCINYVKTKYGLQANLEKYYNLYESLLSHK